MQLEQITDDRPGPTVVRRSPFSISARFVTLLLAVLAVGAADVVYRNERSAALVRAIEDAESVLLDVQRGTGPVDDPVSAALAAEYADAVVRVAQVDGFVLYPAIAGVRDAYLAHASAWQAAFTDPVEEAVAAIDSSWVEVCARLGSLVPYLDYSEVGRSLFYLRARGGCPES